MTNQEKYCNTGLLIIRLGLGAMFIYHGAPKIFAGAQMWEGLGKAMGVFGISFAPQFWGFMASLAEFGGGICLIAGLLFRPACFLLTVTMAVAAAMLLNKGEGLAMASHAMEAGIVFFGLMFTGPGAFILKLKSPCGCCCSSPK